jgi:hypothetical protein
MENRTSLWGRLRWPIKAIIIALPLLLCLWLANKYNWIPTNTENSNAAATNSSGEQNNENTTTGNSDNKTTSTNQKIPTASSQARTFNYSPEVPVNPTMKGVIEVGATGFNSFVVNIDKEKRWQIVSKDFGKSFVYEGMATTEDIRKGLRDYIANMGDKGVMSKNIHFVISSGAMKEPKTSIISSELKKMGFVVNTVTAEQEGKLALKSVLPKAYYDNSFVVDIGSGNTKISYPTFGTTTIAYEGPGAKYYEKGMADADAYAEIKTQAMKIPNSKREVCFIIGGVPFELAKAIKVGEQRYTVLNDPSAYTFAADKKKVLCGLNIYKALKEATKCDTFVFDWDANFSIGFLLGLP